MFMNKVKEGEKERERERCFSLVLNGLELAQLLWTNLAVVVIEYNTELKRSLGLLATSSSSLPELAPTAKHVFPFSTG